jgi:histidyl-tRNA synthetase
MNKENTEKLNKRLEKYSDEEKQIFIDWVTPFYDFNEYMFDVWGKTEEDVDVESQLLAEELLKELTIETMRMEDFINLSGNLFEKFAIKYEYPDSKKLNLAMRKHMEIVFKETLTDDMKKEYFKDGE